MGILTGKFSPLSEKTTKKYLNLMGSGVFSWENLTCYNTGWWEVCHPMVNFWSEQHIPDNQAIMVVNNFTSSSTDKKKKKEKKRLVSSQSSVFLIYREIKLNTHEFSFKIPLSNKVAHLTGISDGRLETWKRKIWNFILLYISYLRIQTFTFLNWIMIYYLQCQRIFGCGFFVAVFCFCFFVFVLF